MKNAIKPREVNLRVTSRKVPRLLPNEMRNRGQPWQVESLLRISNVELEKINPITYSDVHLVVSLRGEICPTRTPPLQTPLKGKNFWMDGQVWPCHHPPQASILQTTGPFLTQQQGNLLLIPRCGHRHRQCNSYLRNLKGEKHIFHEQSPTRPIT